MVDKANLPANTLQSKSVTVTKDATKTVMVGGVEYKVDNLVNLPTLKHESGEVVAIRVDAPIREEINYITEEVVVNGEKVQATRENIINVVRVTDLESQQPFEYVCNAMTADNLRGAYPNNDYVGRSFAIRKGDTVPGKRYKAVDVVEISPAS